jgi:hypothetical protein
MLFLGINTPETMDLPPLVPLTPPLPTLPKSKWEVRIVHRVASLLGISLIGKKHGGVMVRSAPNRQIRRGMSLISVNKVDVQTATLSEVVRLLKTRPLDLLFRPAPTGSSISGEPDPHAPPPRPSPNERRDCAAYVHREKRKQELKKKHFAMIQRYRIGPPKNQNNLAEIHMCNYRNTFQDIRESKKAKLKADYFREQWEKRFAGYVRTLELVFDAMDLDNDGTLSRHEIFKAIVTDQHVQDLLALSPNLERLLSPFQFHKSWNSLDEDGGGEVDRAEFIRFAMNSESDSVLNQEMVRTRVPTPLDLVDIDISLLKVYRELRKFAGGIDPTQSQVFEWLSNPMHRKAAKRSHMRRHRASFDRMTAGMFLCFFVGYSPRNESEEKEEGKEEGKEIGRAHV